MPGSLWIGLNDVAVEGEFVWVSGEAVDYTNWAPGEPAGNSPTEDYGGIFVNFGVPGEWHDLITGPDSNDLAFGVVEIIPGPAVWWIFVPVSVMCGHRRRRHK